ncbi:MAG TPA: ACP S-malonyltransferase [Aestuariivirgaceae bacterium]|nr:ACP S-malonyltransferase [Aestuariivirgaceae bacterium]
MAIAFTFPGQGSQHVGMGKALADAFAPARAVFAEVDAALGDNLSERMWSGSEAELTLTENAQPALMAVSMAVMRTLEAEYGVAVTAASFVAGHSLGEYSALTAAGSFSIADGARLLRARGRAMQQATPVGTGAMAALLGLDIGEASEVARTAAQGEICQAANDNAPGQVVVSGHRAAVERAIGLAKEKGAKRAILLPVSAPFHCILMKPAATAMAGELERVGVAAPAVPLVANVTAAATREPDEIRRLLVEQVTGTVRWRETIVEMARRGVTAFYELGAGKVLTGLARRIAPDATATALGSPEDIASAIPALKP